MRQVNSIREVNEALREIQDFMDAQRTNNIDMKGRRVVQASPSKDDYDYVIRKELYDLKISIDVLRTQYEQKVIELQFALNKKQDKV